MKNVLIISAALAGLILGPAIAPVAGLICAVTTIPMTGLICGPNTAFAKESILEQERVTNQQSRVLQQTGPDRETVSAKDRRTVAIEKIFPVPAVLTVEKAIEMGLKNNYNIRIARNSARIASNNTGYGRARFLPGLNASGGLTQVQSEEETNNTFSVGSSDTRTFSGQIGLNWTLFDGFGMFADKKRFDELEKLGLAQSRNVIENTVVAILASYYNLVQQMQLLDVAESALEVSQTRLNKVQVRNELGGASSVDLLIAEVNRNEDRARLINQELAVDIARKELNILLGRGPDFPLEVDKEIRITPLAHDYDDLLVLARERNSALIAARGAKIVSDHSVALARAEFYPRLSLNAGYGYSDRTTERSQSGNGESFFPDRITAQNADASVGLTLSWNLFNGFRNRIALQNAQVEARNQELALREAENQLAGMVRERYLVFLRQLEIIELEEQNMVAAEQNLSLQQDRYEIGTATSLEFRDAQLNLIRALTTLITARFQARLTRLEIEQLIGNIEIG